MSFRVSYWARRDVALHLALERKWAEEIPAPALEWRDLRGPALEGEEPHVWISTSRFPTLSWDEFHGPGPLARVAGLWPELPRFALLLNGAVCLEISQTHQPCYPHLWLQWWRPHPETAPPARYLEGPRAGFGCGVDELARFADRTFWEEEALSYYVEGWRQRRIAALAGGLRGGLPAAKPKGDQPDDPVPEDPEAERAGEDGAHV